MSIKMKSFTKNIYVRTIFTLGAYFLSISVVLLQINTVALTYVNIAGKFLYVVMAEHFIISLLFGYFWLNLTKIKNKYSIISALILPTVFFTAILFNYYLTEQNKDNELIVVGLLAISQFSGIFIGRATNYAISNN